MNRCLLYSNIIPARADDNNNGNVTAGTPVHWCYYSDWFGLLRIVIVAGNSRHSMILEFSPVGRAHVVRGCGTLVSPFIAPVAAMAGAALTSDLEF